MIRVGTSGWVYKPWRGTFYPKGLPQRRELEYMAEHLSSVEINGSFYSLQRPSSYEKWAEQTPDDFVFSVKGARFITHMKRLKEVDTPLANFFASGVLALGPKCGPILWQLPANFPFDPDVLTDFVSRLPKTTSAAADLAKNHDDKVEDRALTEAHVEQPLRHALEARNPGFADPDAYRILRDAGVSLVIADSAGKFPVFEELTADFVYVRLHGDEEIYVSGYTPEALDTWADRIRTWAADRDVYVYFDNDVKSRAPFDAVSLRERLEA